MDYLNFLTLVHNLICLGCLLFTLYASTYLLFKKPPKQLNMQISRTAVVLLYFWFTASSSILLIINVGYILIWWRPTQSIYNSSILYYITGIPGIYVNFVPVADFFLCADRCFTVAFPLHYRMFYRKLLGWCFAATIGVLLTVYFLITKWFSYVPEEPTTTCAFYICLVLRLRYPLIMTYIKYTFCSLNVAADAVLICLIKLKSSGHMTAAKKLNKFVIIISLINIVFAFVPGLIVEFFKQVC